MENLQESDQIAATSAMPNHASRNSRGQARSDQASQKYQHILLWFNRKLYASLQRLPDRNKIIHGNARITKANIDARMIACPGINFSKLWRTAKATMATMATRRVSASQKADGLGYANHP
jgi:hypothetical protein